MVFKYNVETILISVTFLFSINSGCHKPCIRSHYNFAINKTIFYPELDSIAIGDTLFFKSETSSQLTV